MHAIQTWALSEVLKHNDIVRNYEAGDTVFKAGDSGNFMAVLLQGEVEIRKQDEVLTMVEAGSIFGELALIDHQPRSADAVARTACRAALINEAHFYRLVEQTPSFALAVMRILTHRLRLNLNS
jgi:CRP/FNR family transcriptional regulator, cyclic AMP receptor protein